MNWKEFQFLNPKIITKLSEIWSEIWPVFFHAGSKNQGSKNSVSCILLSFPDQDLHRWWNIHGIFIKSEFKFVSGEGISYSTPMPPETQLHNVSYEVRFCRGDVACASCAVCISDTRTPELWQQAMSPILTARAANVMAPQHFNSIILFKNALVFFVF